MLADRTDSAVLQGRRRSERGFCQYGSQCCAAGISKHCWIQEAGKPGQGGSEAVYPVCRTIAFAAEQAIERYDTGLCNDIERHAHDVLERSLLAK